MLLAPSPAPYIALATRPIECPFTVFLPVFEISLVMAPIGPGLQAPTLHFTKAKFSFVQFIQVCKIVFPKALKLAILKVSFEVRPIFPLKSASTLLFSLEKLTHISGARPTWPPPGLYALSML
jgi:hypothetical protein